MKRIVNQRFSLAVVLIIATLSLSAQTGNKIDDSFTWTYDIETDGLLELGNYDCDIIIHTWDKAKVELKLDIVSELKGKDDARVLQEHIDDLDFNHSPSKVSLSTRFWQSRKNIMGKKTMKLDKGKTISYKSFKMKAEIWIPESVDLDFDSKYSKIEMANTSGKLNLDLYNDNLTGKSIDGDMDLVAKYSKIEFDDCNEIVADFYDTDFTAGNAGKCEITSKYSKVILGNTLSQDIDSYNDKYTLESCANLDIVSKYTDLTTEEADRVRIDSYEGSFDIGKCSNVEIINSKYTEFTMETAKDILINTIYEGSLNSRKANSLSMIQSKYVVYKIGTLNKTLSLEDGYEDDLFIDELSPDFKAIKLNGKYLKCETTYNSNLDLKFIANIQYPHLDLENVNLTTRIKIKESSSLEFEAYKGDFGDTMPVISLSGYEIRFTFK